MMATAAAPIRSSKATITFHNELWTAEGARLLLEVDEGWIGFLGDFAWSWHDETYTVYLAICRERNWPCNSHAATEAMLRALREGGISMKLSNATRSSDNCAQWSLIEMRELGAQMRRVVDGRSPAMPWAAQLEDFVENMKAMDAKYNIDDRTVEEFALRAGKYVPEHIVMLIELQTVNRKMQPEINSPHQKAVMEPERRRSISIQSPDDAGECDSEQSHSKSSKRCGASTAVKTTRPSKKRIRKKDEDSSYHDPTSEDEDLLWAEEISLSISKSTDSAIRQLSRQEEGPLEQASGQQQPATDRTRHTDSQDVRSKNHRGLAAVEETSYRVNQRNHRPFLPPRRDTAERASLVYGNEENDSLLSKQRPCDDLRESNSVEFNDDTHLFQSLNPYDRRGKPWGEFVVEVLLAEKVARDEDELDYVRFLRSLYEI
ncbi:hypothetical protein CCR75_002671 [Bremia lactucae]|uniref:Uncharacterized protein n=1 Tax=Bremia lactucae TaxID=4779 RepID=A0A976IHH1_BRELC|nr:hypothetical protein CCR75_002671 [Bremia lactucae]